jgi:formate dehydrogenase subunit delta
LSADKMHKLVHMANQICDYFKVMPEAQGLTGAADHLRAYWTPKMCRELIAFVDGGGSGLNPLAARAVAELKKRMYAGASTQPVGPSG